MANVFLSYDRENTDRARSIASALEQAGHSVWWDRHIKGGSQYSKEIDKALKEADAVVVLWSICSVESAWVRDEAAAGRDSGRLVPVTIDGTQAPLGFGQFQTIDLSVKGRRRRAKLHELIAAVDSFADPEANGKARAPAEPLNVQRSRKRLFVILGIAAMLAGLALALSLWKPWGGPTLRSVAVVGADNNTNSQRLTRELTVQLSGLPMPQQIRLVDDPGPSEPDMLFKVSGERQGNALNASLVLLGGRDRAILWSKDFIAPAPAAANLSRQMAFNAGRALQCAYEAASSRLRSETSKLYVDTCVKFAGTFPSEDVEVLLPALRQVVFAAPRFEPALEKLLLGEAAATPTLHSLKEASQAVQRRIEAARSAQLALAEADLAEAQLLAPGDRTNRLRLIDRAARREPENPYVSVARSAELMNVGRLDDALEDAERAARIAPLSTTTRSTYILALAYSGRLSRAFDELRQAELLFADDFNVIDARFRLNMRYGDPRIALDLLRQHGTSQQHEAFLVAKIAPTPANIEMAIGTGRASTAQLKSFGSLVHILTAFGRHNEAVQLLLQWPNPRHSPGDVGVVFRPDLKPVRADARFMLIAKRFGLLDYWRSNGKWPDFCFEPDLPYDCKREAAKLAAAAAA